MTSHFSDMSWKPPSLHFSHSSLSGFSFPQAPSPNTSKADASPSVAIDEPHRLSNDDSEEKLPPPLMRPPAGRRGHAHRRSAAKTGIDFDAIARAKSSHSAEQDSRPSLHQRRRSQSGPPTLAGGSCPTTTTNENLATPPSSLAASDSSISPTVPPPGNSTVSHSDTPDPLSRIPPNTKNLPVVSEDEEVATTSRRKSTNAVVDALRSVGRTASTMLDAAPTSQRPKSAIALATPTPPRGEKSSAKKTSLEESVVGRDNSCGDDVTTKKETNEQDCEDKAFQKQNNKKKSKKPRPWAGIITRKGKKKGKKVKKSASKTSTQRENPAAPSTTVELKSDDRDDSDAKEDTDGDEDEGPDFSDMDGIVVLQSPSDPGEEEPDDLLQDTFEEAWKPLSFYEQGRQLEKDAKAFSHCSSPTLDLDAALGPFRAPDTLPISIDPMTGSHDADDEVGDGEDRLTPLRRMYSRDRSHRRSESMPIISAPSNMSKRSSFYAFAQAAASTEVFDETEEDAFWANAG